MKLRRDSTVSELDERLKEAKLTNKKFRKQLLQKDSELQVSFSDHQTFKRRYSKYYFAGVTKLLANDLRYAVCRKTDTDALSDVDSATDPKVMFKILMFEIQCVEENRASN